MCFCLKQDPAWLWLFRKEEKETHKCQRCSKSSHEGCIRKWKQQSIQEQRFPSCPYCNFVYTSTALAQPRAVQQRPRPRSPSPSPQKTLRPSPERSFPQRVERVFLPVETQTIADIDEYIAQRSFFLEAWGYRAEKLGVLQSLIRNSEPQNIEGQLVDKRQYAIELLKDLKFTRNSFTGLNRAVKIVENFLNPT